MKMRQKERMRIQDRVLVLTLLVQVMILVNQVFTLNLYARQSFQASIAEPRGESLMVHLNTDTGRPRGLVEEVSFFLGQRFAGTWVGGWYVSGQERHNATVSVSITVTGSNVLGTASVDYYVEARSGAATHRFLQGTGQTVAVGGAALQASDARTITGHLEAMGLPAETATVSYYVYVKAEATGSVSGDTLTSEIEETLFDTKEYVYDEYGEWLRGYSSFSTGYMGEARHATETVYLPTTYTAYGRAGETSSASYTSWLSFAQGDFKAVPDYPVSGIYSTSRPLPPGSVIKEAHLGVQASQGSNQRIRVYIYPSNTWSSTTADTYAKWLTVWGSRGEDVAWQTGAWSSGVYYHSPDTLNPVLERYALGWTTSNFQRFTFFVANDGDTVATPSRFTIFGYSGHTNNPHLYIRFVAPSASWYPLPPLSLASLPITLDVIALSALIAATLAVYTTRTVNPTRRTIIVAATAIALVGWGATLGASWYPLPPLSVTLPHAFNGGSLPPWVDYAALAAVAVAAWSITRRKLK